MQKAKKHGKREDDFLELSRSEYEHIELRGLMEDAPDEQTKMEFQRLISKMENM